MKRKKVTYKKNFYFTVLDLLRKTTKLTLIQDELGLSKQQLNYYLRKLKQLGFIYQKGYGWWEVTEKGKNPTKYDILLEKDSVRGHAYIWETEIENIPSFWDHRIEILKKKNIHFKLVGAKKTTPRIKVLGRKVWLCNDHLRIFDIEKTSYYGKDAVESRKNSKLEAMRVVHALENKLGIKLNPQKILFKKEHYALIRNDLAIEHNQKGIIMRIDDDNGEWLLIDDSLGEGGELETIGKKAFQTNIPLKKWWNDNKKHDFQVTPTFLMESLTKITKNFELAQKEIFTLKEQNKLMFNQLYLHKESFQINTPSYIQ